MTLGEAVVRGKAAGALVRVDAARVTAVLGALGAHVRAGQGLALGPDTRVRPSPSPPAASCTKGEQVKQGCFRELHCVGVCGSVRVLGEAAALGVQVRAGRGLALGS